MTFDAILEDRVSLVADEYTQSNVPWIIGFSGGKDSSLVVKLFCEALLRARRRRLPVHIVYCDTGVEIPVVADFVKKTLRGIRREAALTGLPIQCHVAMPRIEDRFFVRVIGRGYAPPTNRFRWCTDKLRIRPIRQLMTSVAGAENVVVLGVRQSESEERRRVLDRHSTQKRFYYLQSQAKGRRLFCPIVDLDVSSVWEGLAYLERPQAIDVGRLAQIYKQAGGECPVLRDSVGTPCGQGRFGCWTCTVVRKDKAVQGLVDEGHETLRPLLDFRNWTMAIRDDPAFRCTVRRNGAEGLGPFRLAARKTILKKLLSTERRSGLKLVSSEEIELIRHLWALDETDSNFREDPPRRRARTRK